MICFQAILILAKLLPADQLIELIQPQTYSEVAAVILGLSKEGYTPKQISDFGGIMQSEYVQILLGAIDTTHSFEGKLQKHSYVWDYSKYSVTLIARCRAQRLLTMSGIRSCSWAVTHLSSAYNRFFLSETRLRIYSGKHRLFHIR